MKEPPEYKSWFVRPKTAKVSKDNLGDRQRRLDIQVNDEPIIKGPAHTWDAANEHDYKDTEHWSAINWHPGDKLTVSMMYDPGPFSSWKPVVTRAFDGPLALWRLLNEQLGDPDGSRIEFAIYKFPGPGPVPR